MEKDFEKYKLRYQRIENITFPLNEDNKLIIPNNKSGYGYKKIDTSQYKFINKQYLDNFIDKINQQINLIIKYNKLEEIKDYQKYNKLIFYIIVFWGTLLIILIISLIFNPDSEFSLSVLLFIVLTIFISLIIFLTIKILCQKMHFKVLDDELYINISEILENENENIRNKKIKWKIEQNMYWLELIKENN